MMQELKRIGPYRLVEALDAGGMGTVFKAYDERLNRELAIKVIRHDRIGRPGAVDRFQREARAVAAVNHPYLVQIYDLIELDEDFGLVMELVEGQTLARKLEDGPLAIGQVVRLLSEIAEGLTAIHDQGIVHRDLKAENIIITPHGHVKIMDFGLAQSLDMANLDDESMSSRPILGTPSAMSPEQARGDRLDNRSDLFSFGVLAYEALTGVRPFEGVSPIETLSKICLEHHVPIRERRPEISEELSNLVDRLLEKDPADRPANAREILDALGEDSPVILSGALGPTKENDDPWNRASSGTASVSATNVTGSIALEAPTALSWARFWQWIRFVYYRLVPSAAYRRHAELVDQSFRETLKTHDDRELARLEEHLDRLEEPGWRDTRDDLIRLRDELRARKVEH